LREIKLLSDEEVRRVLQILEERFGAKTDKLAKNYLFFKDKKGKIWICTQEIGKIELKRLKIQKIGLYFGFFESKRKLRLSIEGTQLIGSLATKNVIELTREEMELWMRGLDLEKRLPKSSKVSEGPVILKCGDDFLGSGVYREGRIMNMVPKERRIKRL